jgi:hypothetical protein
LHYDQKQNELAANERDAENLKNGIAA